MNRQNYKDSAIVLMSAVIVYSTAALVGVAASGFEPNSMWGILLANAATILYKMGHVPLAASAAPFTTLVMCQLTNCNASMNEKERDRFAYFMFSVLFLGLCFAR